MILVPLYGLRPRLSWWIAEAQHGMTHCDKRAVSAEGLCMQVIPKLPNATRPPVMRSMSYNPAENALLINSDEEGGTYRFFKLAGGAPASLVSRGEVPETFSGQGGTAVFIARNRFAVWNRFSSTIQVRSFPP